MNANDVNAKKAQLLDLYVSIIQPHIEKLEKPENYDVEIVNTILDQSKKLVRRCSEIEK
jgi:hypothetical protein